MAIVAITYITPNHPHLLKFCLLTLLRTPYTNQSAARKDGLLCSPSFGAVPPSQNPNSVQWFLKNRKLKVVTDLCIRCGRNFIADMRGHYLGIEKGKIDKTLEVSKALVKILQKK